MVLHDNYALRCALVLVCLVLCVPVLEEVKDTYHDVRRLEASILELHKMFMDLALLVDRQGEMLDQIEYQVMKLRKTRTNQTHFGT